MTTTAKKAPPKKRARSKAVATVKRKTAPVVQEPQSQEGQIVGALMKSIESGSLQPEQLDMVLNAQERILDRQAKQEYFADMAICQGEIPSVLKNKYNEQTQSYFEDLESLNKQIKPVYTRHGFGVSFNSAAPLVEGNVCVKGTCSHRSGWSEEFTLELPVDDKGIKGSVNKTGVHGVASTRSYARRYLLKEIFNITTSDDVDDDGNAAGGSITETITTDQAIVISDLIKEVKANEVSLLNWVGVSHINLIPASKYDLVVRVLEEKRK